MKKTLLTIAVGFMAVNVFAQIPNNSFENWTTVNSYEIPDGWGTMNNTTDPFSIYTATKASPGNPGSSYLKLTSKSAGGSVVNGIAVSGQLDSLTMQPISGFAFTQRPASFGGKWQHMIFGNSQGSVKVLTTRWNTTTSMRDTIAHVETVLSGMAMSWANFNMNLMYIDSLHYPDSCIIVLQASGINPTNNDYLWVDNLAFTGTVAVVSPPNTVGLKELKNVLTQVSLFPNPASESVNLSFYSEQSQQINIAIYDVTGRLIYTHKKMSVVGEMNEKIDIKGFAKGTYLLKISGQEGTETKTLIVE